MTIKPLILLIDDDESIFYLLEKLLVESAGYDIAHASSGESAITALEQLTPDLILLDIEMPGGWDGFRTLQEIKPYITPNNIPVLFLSAYIDQECRIKGFSSGAKDIISKPFQNDELLARIKTHLDLHQSQKILAKKNTELATAMTKLQAYGDKLELLVDERTAELKQARDEAQAASKAKSTFLTLMSHELRTPLNHIIGYSNFLTEEVDHDSHIYSAIRAIENAGGKLFGMIENILILVQLESGTIKLYPTMLNLKEDLICIVDQYKPIAAENNNQLTLKVTCKIEKIQTDAEKFNTVLNNILRNACTFTNNGKIDILLEYFQENDLPWIKITISDTGIGISEHQYSLEYIFKMFTQGNETASRSYQGMGIGLAIAHEYCKAMGGDIKVKSQVGAGASFTILLPVHITT